MPGLSCQQNARSRTRVPWRNRRPFTRCLDPRGIRTYNACTWSGWNSHVCHVGRDARAHYYARIYHDGHDYPNEASPNYNGYNHT
jgi:hypothetical protein